MGNEPSKRRMFDARGLLTTMLAEDVQKSYPNESFTHKISESTSTVNSRTLDSQAEQEPLECISQCYDGVQELSLASGKNPATQVIALSDLPPIEAALSIEQIRNAIFSSLEPSDLLQCRLVSSSWLRMATNGKLLEWSRDKISIYHYVQKRDPAIVTFKGQTRRRGLKDLTDSLDAMGSLSILRFAKVHLHMTLAPHSFFKFLDHYGFIAIHLSANFESMENGKDFVYHMSSLLTFVTKLLTEQTPNLEDLEIRFKGNTKFVGSIDPNLLLSIQSGSYFAGKQNQKLRYFEFCEQTPHEIIDAVCCLAPKLYGLNAPLEFWKQHTHRLYLLKIWGFHPSLEDWDQVVAFESLVDSSEKLYLECFGLNFSRVSDNPELWPYLSSVVVKIFGKSCHSLKQLSLNCVYFPSGAVFPPMPQLEHLSFSFDESMSFDNINVLPKGISIATTFPTLNEINFFTFTPALKFLSLCKNEDVTSVREIYIFGKCNEKFQSRFPNADVKIVGGY